jgi:hypothetical protein
VVNVRPLHALALLPVVALVGAPWLANRVEPRVLGLPFLLAWIVGWVLATAAIMAFIGARDRRLLARSAAASHDATPASPPS